MSLISYSELCSLIDLGVIENSNHAAVNSASIDLTLGNNFLLENKHVTQGPESILYLNKKSQLSVEKITLEDRGVLVLAPGECVLAQTKEIFHLPSDISGEYKLKSSMARIFLEHLNAGWMDSGWNGSVLTLELKNVSQYHRIALTVGDRIGQAVFFRHEPVPADKSYAARGSYNGDKEVRGVAVK
jgi:deoxycytidine triphosphate deaminase